VLAEPLADLGVDFHDRYRLDTVFLGRHGCQEGQGPVKLQDPYFELNCTPSFPTHNL
jgi:hypothetical protein